MDNILKELYNLREFTASCPANDQPRINRAIESLDSEIRLIIKELDRYKV